MAVCLSAGVALAALPQAGDYRGTTGEAPVNGFKPPLSFTVSRDGKKLLSFKWGSEPCSQNGRTPKGDPWSGASPWVHEVPMIRVSPTGRFAVTNYKSTSGSGSQTVETTVTIKGRFATSRLAKGTISYTQAEGNTFCGSFFPSPGFKAQRSPPA